MVEPTIRYHSTENSENCPVIIGIPKIATLNLEFIKTMITAVLIYSTKKIFIIFDISYEVFVWGVSNLETYSRSFSKMKLAKEIAKDTK